MPNVVFVMGPCLDPSVLRAFASEHGFDVASVRSVGRAYLPDAHPRFVQAEGHFAYTHAPARGSAAAGALFECQDGLRLMDAAHARLGWLPTRERRVVLTDDGGFREVEAYVAPGADTPSARPTQAEVDAVKRGLLRYGHDASAVKAAAEARRPATEPQSVFVYGTLRKGLSRAGYVDKHDPFEGGKGVVHGSVPGKLYDLGEYPGLVPHGDRLARVQGEVYTFADLDTLFGELDQVEGFHGYGRRDNDYVRAIVRVDLDARERIAWTYVYAGDVSACPVVQSGDWALHAAAG